MNNQGYINEYYFKIKSGDIITSKWIHAIYKIIIEGLENNRFFFNEKKANKAIDFIETFCRHSEGRRDLIKLELWQKAMLSVIFGIVDENDIRVFREVFIVIGRKNGKSLLASAIIAYMAYLDGEWGAKIYCIAPKLEQAEKVFDGFHKMVINERELASISLKRRTDIYIADTNTSVSKLAFNYKKSDSFNPSLVINDEVSSWRGDPGLRQYQVMKSSLGARKQPLIISITTSGYENDGVYDELINRSTSFLKGNSRERRLLPFLYIIDDVEKWNDINELRKSNPNLGVSISQEYFTDGIITAESSAKEKAEFLTKYCNIKQNSSYAWLDYLVVDKASEDQLTLNDFKGAYAVGGFDLSQSVDLTAASVIIENKGKLYAFTQFFMPANKLETSIKTDGIPYDIFVKNGTLKLSGENKINLKDVYNWFVEIREKYKIYIMQIGYDRYSAQYLVDDLKGCGYKLDDVHQGTNLMGVLNEFEGILKDGNFYIVRNELLKAHFLNVALKRNEDTRSFRPIKLEQRARIDGAVSVICAMTVRQKWWSQIGEYLQNKKFKDVRDIIGTV